MYKLSKEELETHVNYTEADEFGEVYTHSKGLMKKLDKLCKDFPEHYKLKSESKQWGSKTYYFPIKCLSFKKPTKLSDETKLKRSENMKKNRQINQF